MYSSCDPFHSSRRLAIWCLFGDCLQMQSSSNLERKEICLDHNDGDFVKSEIPPGWVGRGEVGI